MVTDWFCKMIVSFIYIYFWSCSGRLRQFFSAFREQGVSVDFSKLQVKKKKQESAQEDVEAREKALFSKVVTCESCGRKGHKKDKCSTRCYECGKIGHMAANCPTKGGGDEEGSGKGKRKALFARGEIFL
jgi:Zinc knuckle